MHTPHATPPHRAVDQRRALVRLAVVALRRTAFENSVNLLAAAAALVLLADGARRVNGPGALDRWLVAAVTMAVVLPVALGRNDPLRSARLALLPVPRRVLHRARVIASAPLRLPLAATLLTAGSVVTYRVASSAAVLTLVGWGVACFFAGAAFEERWHRPRALAVRAVAAAMASLAVWCLWSLRGTEQLATASALASWIPALLPRGDGAADWLIALGALASSAALGVVVLRAPRGSDTAARLVSVQENPVVGRRRVRMFNGTSFPRIVRPSVAHEVALLARHVGSRTSLAVVAALACAACYGRVPGLALIAISPMILLAANMLGADVALGGLTRHRLQPASLTQLRDRRLTVWSVSAALVTVLGAIVGLMLPSPETAGTPTGGVFAAPAMLLYAVGPYPVVWPRELVVGASVPAAVGATRERCGGYGRVWPDRAGAFGARTIRVVGRCCAAGRAALCRRQRSAARRCDCCLRSRYARRHDRTALLDWRGTAVRRRCGRGPCRAQRAVAARGIHANRC